MFNSRSKHQIRLYNMYLRTKNIDNNDDDDYQYSTNRKKIRNWKKIMKCLLKLKEDHIFNSMDEFHQAIRDNYLYMKLDIDPFNRLEKRNPPKWFMKYFIQILLDIYDNWEQYCKLLGMPYYLKIWLYEENFSCSRIMMSINNRIEYYENIFGTHEDEKPLTERYKLENKATDLFNWKYVKSLYLFEEDSQEFVERKAIKKLIAENKIWRYETLDPAFLGMSLYHFHDDNVWVGCKK